MADSGRFDVTKGPLLLKIFRFSLPLMAAGILQLGFNMVDSMVVGRFDGSRALASVGATTTIINLLVNGFIGLSVGATVVISQSMGAKDYKRASEYAHASITVSLMLGVIMGICGFFVSGTALKLMGVPAEVLPLSRMYLRIYFIGTPVSLLYNFGSAIMRTVGDTKRPMLYLGVGGIVNVFLNLLFVIVFKLSVAGVAIATVISNIVSAVLVMRDLMTSGTCCRINIKELGFKAEELKNIFAIGFPACIQSAMFSISNIIMQSSINSFGAAAIAGNTAAQSLEGFQMVALDGFTQSCTTFVGQNFGAKKPSRIMRVWGLCLLCSVIAEIVFVCVMIPLRFKAIALFIPDDAKAVAFASKRYVIMCSTHIFAAVMNITVGALRSMGKSLLPMLQSIFGVCILRLIYIFTYFRTHRDYITLMSIYPATWFITACVLVCMFLVCCRRFKRELQINGEMV